MALSALATGCFKTREDGSKVFFPWGPGAVGYLIPSERRFERLQEQMSAWLGAGMPFVMFPFTAFSMLAFDSYFGKVFIGVVVALAYIGAYSVWVRIQCSRLVPTDEKLTVNEWAAIPATTASRIELYLYTLLWMPLLVASIYAVALRSESMVALLFMAFYAVFVAVAGARILREKKRLKACPS